MNVVMKADDEKPRGKQLKHPGRDGPASSGPITAGRRERMARKYSGLRGFVGIDCRLGNSVFSQADSIPHQSKGAENRTRGVEKTTEESSGKEEIE